MEKCGLAEAALKSLAYNGWLHKAEKKKKRLEDITWVKMFNSNWKSCLSLSLKESRVWYFLIWLIWEGSKTLCFYY
jgi:hypothetical protein